MYINFHLLCLILHALDVCLVSMPPWSRSSCCTEPRRCPDHYTHNYDDLENNDNNHNNYYYYNHDICGECLSLCAGKQQNVRDLTTTHFHPRLLLL